MNRYDANVTNMTLRIGAWVRGMLRRHRRPLLAIAAATATMAIGVSAGQAPARAPSKAPAVTVAGP